MSIVRRAPVIAGMVALTMLLAMSLASVAQAGISFFSASVTIVKVTDPASDPQDFDFDFTGSFVPADLDLDTDGGDATLPSQFQFLRSEPGPITITESSTAGWDLTGLGCTGDAEASTSVETRTATIDVDNGESIICTFTNTKHASLTVAKVTIPGGDPQDFDFDLTGAGVPADLDLDADPNNATLPSQSTFNLNAAQLGAHTVTESSTPGWSATDIDCTGAGSDSSSDLDTRTATLDIDAGENVVCTFTNTAFEPGSLTIIKETNPLSDPQDFDFDLTGAGLPADLDLDTDASSAGTVSQQTFNISNVQLGFHTVTESTVPGWVLTSIICTGAGDDSSTSLATRTASLSIDAGENVICVFQNTQASAALTIIKQTTPAEDPQDFGFDMTSPNGPGEFSLDTDPVSDLPSFLTFPLDANGLGAYTVTETMPSGWALFGVSCDGDTEAVLDAEHNRVSVDLDAGEHAVCTFYNYVDEQATQPPATDPPPTDPPGSDPAGTDDPATDGPGSPDPTDDNAGETDAATEPGTDTQSQESTATGGSNVVLLVVAFGLLSGVLLLTRPKRGRR